MFSKVYSASLKGMDAYLVRVEADISEGMPQFLMVGYLASEVKEAGDRVRTALRNAGVMLPAKRITVNLAPAAVRKAGSRFDLPVAAAILAAMGKIPTAHLEQVLLVGELSLSGQVLGVPGVLALLEAARSSGIRRCLVPKENAAEGAVLEGMEVMGVSSLRECMEILENPTLGKPERADVQALLREQSCGQEADFSMVNGQLAVKRAVEVAAAGMHNFLMIGPPGSGKTMVARCIPGILPPLSPEESLEITKIYSIAGLLPKNTALIAKRPFRAPHHTVTPEALAGGGRIPTPGEVSLSSRGILFLDELPEFQRSALEILRQPMEEHRVCISRQAGTYEFPASFMLVAAMNPCSCGYYPDRKLCRCAEGEVARYLGRISRPLLDRIDICTETPRLSYEELAGQGENESSADIRSRVEAAHERQKVRYRNMAVHFNSQLDGKYLERFCPLGGEEQKLLGMAYEKLNLSARAYHRVIRVARTIADLEQQEQIQAGHILEALRYRTPEKKFWLQEG
jgi:magnesium chelatase family protein